VLITVPVMFTCPGPTKAGMGVAGIVPGKGLVPDNAVVGAIARLIGGVVPLNAGVVAGATAGVVPVAVVAGTFTEAPGTGMPAESVALRRAWMRASNCCNSICCSCVNGCCVLNGPVEAGTIVPNSCNIPSVPRKYTRPSEPMK